MLMGSEEPSFLGEYVAIVTTHSIRLYFILIYKAKFKTNMAQYSTIYSY